MGLGLGGLPGGTIGLSKKWSALFAFTNFISISSSSVRFQGSPLRPWLKVKFPGAVGVWRNGGDAGEGLERKQSTMTNKMERCE